MSNRSAKIEFFFKALRLETIDLCDQFYHPQIFFQDPIGELRGREAMKDYYRNLYAKVIDIRFDFTEISHDQNRSFAPWTMHMRTKALKGGDWIVVPGLSQIHFDADTELAIYHRDYFDMGGFLYENIPVLGSLVRTIRNRLKHE